MGIQSFTPSGGGGTPGFDYINSVNMVTYNRTWAQAGAAGNYVLASYNKNSGYAYFVGSGVTTGVPLGYVGIVNHAWTSINIVAPQHDYISLFKASVKSTTVYDNALASFSSFPSIVNASGNFVLPNNALPLVNVLVVGGGGASGAGHGSTHGGGGGGGGGGIVSLTAYQAVGTTSVTVGTGGTRPDQIYGTSHGGGTGNRSFFGNVYAIGGGGGKGWQGNPQPLGANSGGGCGGSEQTPHGVAAAQTASTGLGVSGSPVYYGGFSGGQGYGPTSQGTRGGGGGGAGGNGGAGGSSAGGDGGIGHTSTITGSSYQFAAGGAGCNPNNNHGSNPNAGGYGCGSYGSDNDPNNGSSVFGRAGNAGVVVVRYYIP
jgi:hypothetical protein